uniref:Amine oxidase n=1 Tax=Dermatophagoides pteronyssinus TaxID=6956 RepID=A0A6P6XL16_DERPT|nr:uncharacterized protein LOC113788373 [Dermatophagoides pteronyssinus]
MLQLAVKRASIKIFQELISKGADIFTVSVEGKNLLQEYFTPLPREFENCNALNLHQYKLYNDKIENNENSLSLYSSCTPSIEPFEAVSLKMGLCACFDSLHNNNQDTFTNQFQIIMLLIKSERLYLDYVKNAEACIFTSNLKEQRRTLIQQMQVLKIYILLCSTLKAHITPCSNLIYNKNRTQLLKTIKNDFIGCDKDIYRVYIQEGDTYNASSLEEVKVWPKRIHYCSEAKPCEIAVQGQYLDKGDMFIVIPYTSDCGTKNTPVFSKAVLDNIIIYDLSEHVITDDSSHNSTYYVATFKIDLPDYVKNAKICYLTKKSLLNTSETDINNISSDYFWQEAGAIQIRPDILFQCDFKHQNFEEYGIKIIQHERDLNLIWTISNPLARLIETEPKNIDNVDHLQLAVYDIDNQRKTDLVTESNNNNYALFRNPGYIGSGHLASLLLPPLILSDEDYCLEFYYYMNGVDTNSLEISYFTKEIGNKSLKPKSSVVNYLWKENGNKGSQWNQARINLKLIRKQMINIFITATSGLSELASIAFKDIHISEGKCASQNLLTQNNFSTNDYSICGEARMMASYFPQNKHWTIDGALSCSGRGSSLLAVTGIWVKCCLPSFGNYIVRFNDTSKEGWLDSLFELKFFNKKYTVMKNFNKSDNMIAIDITIGTIYILNLEYHPQTIIIQVRTLYPNLKVYCGLTEAMKNESVRFPIPTREILKEYGVQANKISEVNNDTLTVEITGSFVKENIIFDVYCYSEVVDSSEIKNYMAFSETSIENLEMTNEEIAATRRRIITDTSPTQLSLLKITYQDTTVNITLKVDEKSIVWCYTLPINSSVQINNDMIRSLGLQLNYAAATTQNFVFKNLKINTIYQLYCTAQDFAYPKKNITPNEIAKISMKDINGKSVNILIQNHVPKLTITRVVVVNHGFDLSVQTDTAGIVYCAASKAKRSPPSLANVLEVASFVRFEESDADINLASENILKIRGVEPNVQYKIYCIASDLNKENYTSESEMITNSLSITSYGNFCKAEVYPKLFSRTTEKTPFDPITTEEEVLVKSFLANSSDWNVELIYRIDLFLDKKKIYDYYDNRGELPDRYARVRLGRCLSDHGFYEQLVVGPLNANKMEWRRIANPRKTSCSGYKTDDCVRPTINAYDDCLYIGNIISFTDDEIFNDKFFVGLNYDWNEFNGGVYWNNLFYENLTNLKNDIRKNRELISIKEVEQKTLRNLEAKPFAGGPGTAGVDIPVKKYRSGLEYRLPPEHVEPNGKRYEIKVHPKDNSYTISYLGWSFIITNDRDKSLQFWNVYFQNERILFNMGLQEAMAHYTVAERTFFFMDSWYGGLGGSARPILRGYECPKTGVLLFHNQSVCIFEKDEARPIRSHYRSGNIKDAAGHYSLNVRQMITVSNYDYIVTYTFHSSGHLESTISFTGELYAGVEIPWYSARQEPYGTQVTGSLRMGALHAHLAVWKYDFDLMNYEKNSVYFEEVIADPKRSGANFMKKYFPSREKEAAIKITDSRSIGYSIVADNNTIYNNPRGWRAVPSVSWSPHLLNHDLYNGPGAWAKYKIFTTVYKESELDATLPRDNKFAADYAVSVENYISDDEPVKSADLVTWMSMNFMHIPASEDYPLTIPIGNTLSSMIRPFNWFLEDPTMDLSNNLANQKKDRGPCAIVRQSIKTAMTTKHMVGPVVA